MEVALAAVEVNCISELSLTFFCICFLPFIILMRPLRQSNIASLLLNLAGKLL